jgi:hypothetical protein
MKLKHYIEAMLATTQFRIFFFTQDLFIVASTSRSYRDLVHSGELQGFTRSLDCGTLGKDKTNIHALGGTKSFVLLSAM